MANQRHNRPPQDPPPANLIRSSHFYDAHADNIEMVQVQNLQTENVHAQHIHATHVDVHYYPPAPAPQPPQQQQQVFHHQGIQPPNLASVQYQPGHDQIVNQGASSSTGYQGTSGRALPQPVQQNPEAQVVQHENPEAQNQATASQGGFFRGIARFFSSWTRRGVLQQPVQKNPEAQAVQHENPEAQNQATASQGGALQQPVQQNPEAQVLQQENPEAQNQATASQDQPTSSASPHSSVKLHIAAAGEGKDSGATASMHDGPGLSKSESIEHYSPVYAEKKPSDQPTSSASPCSSPPAKQRRPAAGKGKDSGPAPQPPPQQQQQVFHHQPGHYQIANQGGSLSTGYQRTSGGSSRSDDVEYYPAVYRREEPSGTQRMSIQDINSSPHAQKFVNYHNEKSWKKTNVQIAESYKDQKLHKPAFEVNPQLRKVERFYSGGMAPDTTEYKKEAGFAYTAEEKNLGKVITPGEVVEQLSKPDCRYMAIIGQAGSGKTTIVKRLTRRIITDNSLVDEASTLSSHIHNPKFKFVHHINIKNIPFCKANQSKEAIDPCTLLFGNTGLTRQEMEEGYKWVQQNQAVLAFALDGLDQAPWNLQGEYNMMEYYDKSSTATIIYNLIIGNLFPDATILISSREHSIASLPLELQPQYIVSLAGLVREDIEKLFIAVLGETGEESWRKLTVQSPALIPFSSVPICLIFNAIVHKFNPENPPDTMTEVMIQILIIFMRSDNTQEQSWIQVVLHKLMEMSFKGTKKNRVLFTIDDLCKVGLKPDDVRDIIIKVPGNNMLSQHLMKTDVIMSFSHEILQEVLSAFYIANMNLSTFRSFITEEIHNDHWSVVLRFLCGIVLNQSIDGKLIKDISKPTYSTNTKKDEEEKKKLLRRTLTTMFNQSNQTYQQLELFGALYEANDDKLIRSLVRRIYFYNTSLSAAGMYAISSVMRRCYQIEQVGLRNCGLNFDLMRIMNSNLKDSGLRLDELSVSWNKNLGTASGCGELGSVVSQCQVKKLNAIKCDITIDGIKALKENTRNAKLDELNVSHNKNLGTESGCSELGSVVSQCQVKKLRAGYCDITIDGIKVFKENTCNAKIKVLRLTGNKVSKLGGDEGLSTISEIVHQCQVETLGMVACDFNKDQLKRFKASIADTRVEFKY